MSDAQFLFVSLEFTSSLGPPPGRYPVTPLEPDAVTGHDALLISVVGAAPARPMLLRRPRALEPDAEVREVSLLQVTWVQTSEPVARRGDAERLLATVRRHDEREAIIEHALGLLNRAIRAYAVAAGDPFSHEVSRLDPREIRIGVGTGEEIDAGRFSGAFSCPPPATNKAKLVERLRPSEAVLAALTGRTEPLEGELHLLRVLLDLELGRDHGAALELEAALDLLVRDLPTLDAGLVAQYLSAPLARADALFPDGDGVTVPARLPAAADVLAATLELLDATAGLRGVAVAANAA